MGSDDWPDWLPADWSVHLRKIDGSAVKCYIHPDGYVCYSEQEVLDYINTTTEKTSNADYSTIDLSMDPNAPDINELSESLPGVRPSKLTPRPIRKKSPPRNVSEDVLASGGSSTRPSSSQKRSRDNSWLPEGWTVEVKVRKGGTKSGMRYKCFTDPVTGHKFFSKPQVMAHLERTGRRAGGQKEVFAEPISAIPISAWQENQSTDPDNSQMYEPVEDESKDSWETEGARLSSDDEVLSRTPVEGLPAGWIKEVRVLKHETPNRKQAYYLDPLSEYAFCSKIDALRYLETGDVTKCLSRPLLRDLNDVDIHNANLTFTIEELTSPDPSIGTQSPTELPNGSVEGLKTYENGIENPKPVRSITGGNFSSPKEQRPTWLPVGWVVEVNYKSSGQKFKVFKELASGKRLYSKPQVLQYLNNGSNSGYTKRKVNTSSVGLDLSPNGTIANGTPSTSSTRKKGRKEDCKEVITTSEVDGLGPGWIKKVVTKTYPTHIRSDSFYVDPATGYTFRSKVDAKRYLDSGDLSLCASKPIIKINRNEVSVDTQDVQKPWEPTTGKQPSEDKGVDLSTENHEQNQPANPEIAPANQTANPETAPETAVNTKLEVNLEKQPDNDGDLACDIPGDENWEDQCIDFAVKTLANEIMLNDPPIIEDFQVENAGVNETPTKVN